MRAVAKARACGAVEASASPLRVCFITTALEGGHARKPASIYTRLPVTVSRCRQANKRVEQNLDTLHNLDAQYSGMLVNTN